MLKVLRWLGRNLLLSPLDFGKWKGDLRFWAYGRSRETIHRIGWKRLASEKLLGGKKRNCLFIKYFLLMPIECSQPPHLTDLETEVLEGKSLPRGRGGPKWQSWDLRALALHHCVLLQDDWIRLPSWRSCLGALGQK